MVEMPLQVYFKHTSSSIHELKLITAREDLVHTTYYHVGYDEFWILTAKKY